MAACPQESWGVHVNGGKRPPWTSNGIKVLSKSQFPQQKHASCFLRKDKSANWYIVSCCPTFYLPVWHASWIILTYFHVSVFYLEFCLALFVWHTVYLCFLKYYIRIAWLLHFLLSFSWQTLRNHRDKQRIRELARQKKEVKFVSNRKGTNQYDDGRFSLNSHKTSFIKNECLKSNAEF